MNVKHRNLHLNTPQHWNVDRLSGLLVIKHVDAAESGGARNHFPSRNERTVENDAADGRD